METQMVDRLAIHLVSYLAYHLGMSLGTPMATTMATQKEWNSDLRLETKSVHRLESH